MDLLTDEEQRLRRVADPALIGPHRFWLAHMHTRFGKLPDAHRFARESVEAATTAGDDVTLGKALGVMSLNAYWQGHTTESTTLGRRAVEVLKGTPERYWLGMAYFYLAMNYIQAGDTPSALQAADDTSAVGEGIPDPRVVAYGRFARGWAQAAAGDEEAALRECQQSLQRAPDTASRAYALAFLGYSYLAKGDAKPAVKLLEEAVSNFSAFHFPPFEGLFCAKLAEARLLLGDLAGARKDAERGRELTIKCGYRYGAGWACRSLAHVAHAEGDNAEGSDLLEQAQTIFADIGAAIELQRTTKNLVG